jgi:hypothetical protein
MFDNHRAFVGDNLPENNVPWDGYAKFYRLALSIKNYR